MLSGDDGRIRKWEYEWTAEDAADMVNKLGFHYFNLRNVLRGEVNSYIDWDTYAVSSLDGIIYFTPAMALKCYLDTQPTYVREIMAFMEAPARKRLLIRLTDEMRALGMVADHLLEDGQFAARFRMFCVTDEVLKLLIPLRAACFYVDVSELELEKEPHIKRFNSITLAPS